MADVKISALPSVTAPLVGTETFECVQSGTSSKVAASVIAAAYSTDAANVLPVANGGTAKSSWTSTALVYASGATTLASATTVTYSGTSLANAGSIKSSHATAGIGYTTGAGATVSQATNRTTGVTINATCGAITLFSTAGSATPATFTVSNSAVAATDNVLIQQKSGTDLYVILVTAIGAGSFNVTSYTTGGTTSEAPVFSFCIIKGVTS